MLYAYEGRGLGLLCSWSRVKSWLTSHHLKYFETNRLILLFPRSLFCLPIITVAARLQGYCRVVVDQTLVVKATCRTRRCLSAAMPRVAWHKERTTTSQTIGV